VAHGAEKASHPWKKIHLFPDIETAYLHYDSSGYIWRATLNEQLEARGFMPHPDRQQRITWKELKAVRLAVLSSYRLRTAERCSCMRTTKQ
jgi:hypothetical protein